MDKTTNSTSQLFKAVDTTVTGADQSLLGEDYQDAVGNSYSPLLIQPIIVLSADGNRIKTIYRRAMDRGVQLSIYIEDMFTTGHDAANRETVRARQPEDLPIVGLALREEKKLVDKITKGAKMHN